MLKSRRKEEEEPPNKLLAGGGKMMQSCHILGLIDQFHQESTAFKSDIHKKTESFYGGQNSQHQHSMSQLTNGSDIGASTKGSSKLKLSIKRP